MPFGGGSRRCIGAEFAKLEMKLIVATILKQMQLAAVDRGEIRPVRYGITMAPPTDLKLKVLKPMEIAPLR
ncbi:cytochrome P450 [Leptolyngbya sp. NIES-2104]|uniref:cytochrome P450 n=1 Tax=Leptolyngbya sp. NIES-2104 TaxID=1552121 RepID=UPI0009EACF17|nr:cytochrome P450 [Leptolyngbya sp. NIES-2104]